MVPTNHISEFIEKNDTELRNMVINVCEGINYPEDPQDVVQDIYLKFLTSKIIQSYDRNFRDKETKMSTYIFPIIRNFILSKFKSREYRFFKHKLPNFAPTDDVDDLDLVIFRNPIALEFMNTLLYNGSTDNMGGLGADFKDFEHQFLHSSHNKKYSLKKRKHEKRALNYLEKLDKNSLEFEEIKDRILNAGFSGCTLLDIFQLLYKGYTNKQIAKIYGVSDMYVTSMKHKLAKVMLRYGLGTKTKSKGNRDRIEMPKMSVRPRNRRPRGQRGQKDRGVL